MDTIIGDILRGVQTRSRLALFCEHFLFVSSIEPKKIDKALLDVDCVNAMHEELNNFKRNQVRELVQRPKDHIETLTGRKCNMRPDAPVQLFTDRQHTRLGDLTLG